MCVKKDCGKKSCDVFLSVFCVLVKVCLVELLDFDRMVGVVGVCLDRGCLLCVVQNFDVVYDFFDFWNCFCLLCGVFQFVVVVGLIEQIDCIIYCFYIVIDVFNVVVGN